MNPPTLRQRFHIHGQFHSAIGAVYTTRWFSIPFLVLVSAASAAYFSTSQTRNNATVQHTFWEVPTLAFYGGAAVALIVALPWIVIPYASAILRPVPARYLLRYGELLGTMLSLGFLTVFAAALTWICVPGVIVDLSAYGYDRILLSTLAWAFTLVPLAGVFKWLLKQHRQRQDRDHLPPLDDFSQLRPLNNKLINLNVGALAPRLTMVESAMREWNRVVDEFGPTSTFIRQSVFGLPHQRRRHQSRAGTLPWSGVARLREQLAEHLGVEGKAIVFARNTTTAIKTVIDSVRPKHLVMSDHEHESCHSTLESCRLKYGTQRTVIPVRYDAGSAWEEPFVQAFVDACVAHQAELALVSHVCHSNGLILPIEKLSRALKARNPGLVLVVDGAHALGQIQLSLEARACDFYVTAGHKWLYGPPCLGILVAHTPPTGDAPDLSASLRQELHEALAFYDDKGEPGTSSVNFEPYVGLSAILHQLKGDLFESLLENISALQMYAVNIVQSECKNLRLCEVRRQAPGILNLQKASAPLSFAELCKLQVYLEESTLITVKAVNQPASLRLCLPFYLRLHELQRALVAIDVAMTRGHLD